MHLRDMRNLGPKLEEWLRLVGIQDPEDLAAVGAAEAYRRLQDAKIPGLSKAALWAMEGALTDTDWRMLPPERKLELLDEL